MEAFQIALQDLRQESLSAAPGRPVPTSFRKLLACHRSRGPFGTASFATLCLSFRGLESSEAPHDQHPSAPLVLQPSGTNTVGRRVLLVMRSSKTREPKRREAKSGKPSRPQKVSRSVAIQEVAKADGEGFTRSWTRASNGRGMSHQFSALGA